MENSTHNVIKSLDVGDLDCPILVFGGPYGNLQATEAIRLVSEQMQIPPRNIICTGDVVAYCGNPNETIDLIRQWNCHVIMGNCEESVGFEKDDCGCGFDEGSVCAALSVNWYNHAIRQVSQDNKTWMQRLPERILFCIGNLQFAVIHGGVENISEFIFESSNPASKTNHLESLQADCVIAGHCGLPFGQKFIDDNQDARFWLNAGVIGMPANEARTHTWYMLIENRSGKLNVSWHQLQFGYQQSISAMQNAGLANEYQITLETGIWPSMSVLPAAEQNQQGKLLNLVTIELNNH